MTLGFRKCNLKKKHKPKKGTPAMPTRTDLSFKIGEDDFERFQQGEQRHEEFPVTENLKTGDQLMYEVAETDQCGWAKVMGPCRPSTNGHVTCSLEWVS